VHLAFVRSVVAHARIEKIDLNQALAMPGVVDVFTGADLSQTLDNDAGPKQPLLAQNEVTYVGQPLAVVAASDRYRAEDAAESIFVDLDELPAVVDIDFAFEDAVQAHAGHSNIVLSNEMWPAELDDILSHAPVVVSGEYRTQRQVATPLEGRGIVAVPELGSDGLVVYASTQMPHLLRDALARHLEIPTTEVRVVAPDVGGAFGVKLAVYPEDLVTAILARRLSRPTSWISDRKESFTSDYQSRGARYRATAAFSESGMWLGLGAEILSPAGAYYTVPWSGALVETFIGSMSLPGPYKIGAYGYRCHGVLTNTTPTCSYRATGGPAATWITETLIDRAARKLDMDRSEIRRRNMIKPDEVPFVSPYGVEIDAPSHMECLDLALEAVGYGGWEIERSDARSEGRFVGLGIAAYVAPTTAGVAGKDPSVAIPFDSTTVRIEPSGHVTVLSGVSSQGQGLATTLAQIVADQLGVDVETVNVRAGDTVTSPYGGGTHGSRAAVLGGAATRLAGEAVAMKLRQIASHHLEASPSDIELGDGSAFVRGDPASAVPIAEIAMRAHLQAQSLPAGLEPALEATKRYMSWKPFTMANGCHAAVVEFEGPTGRFKVLRYVVVQEGGVIINPAIVDGQVRGGVAQGVGSVFLEEMIYGDDGAPLIGTLADYLLPTESDVPNHITIVHVENPSDHPGGMRGIGEAGLHASVAALAGATEDAFTDAGLSITELPIRPEHIAAMVRQLDVDLGDGGPDEPN
jgi:carbon-monoxide dehydrogenase large subunit